MPERTVTVASSVGLRTTRPRLFAQAAAKVGVPVTLIVPPSGKSVNAASILGVLALGVGHDEKVTLAAEGEGAEAAIEELAQAARDRPRQGVTPR